MIGDLNEFLRSYLMVAKLMVAKFIFERKRGVVAEGLDQLSSVLQKEGYHGAWNFPQLY